MTPPVELGASALAQVIRERRLSALEAVDAHLQRIEQVNGSLNAVVQLAAQAARQQAEAADAALARGEVLGPLHGVPFTAKDWLETAGVVSAAGFEERAGFVPERDATVVARMRAAGAILLGKTNVMEHNPVYGSTRNPYDPERTPGASSSGEAAIVAAQGSPVGLGSDSGGSIRYPAHCCGVAGLKPTNGLVPSTGHFPRISAMNDPRTQIGPLARSVEDLALVLGVIAGPDLRDASVVPMPIGDHRTIEAKGLRVATYWEQAGAEPTSETVAAVRRAGEVLADAGMVVSAARPRGIDDALDITRAYWRRVRSVSWRRWVPDGESTLSGEEVDRSLFAWDRLRRAMLAFVESFDLVVAPVCAHPAGPLRTSDELSYLYTLPYSLAGWPVVVVRAGTGPEGLPIGVQIVARPWRDDVALAAAALVEGRLGGFVPSPILPPPDAPR